MKTFFKINLFILSFGVLSSCVPQRKFAELQTKYDELSISKLECDTNYQTLKLKQDTLTKEINDLREDYSKLLIDFREKESLYDRVKKSYDQLTENYEKRIASESLTKDELKKSLRELEEKLQKKELELNQKEANLLKKEEESKKLGTDMVSLEKSLKDREEKVKELEQLLKQKDESVSNLKETLTKALVGYKESGLTVTSKDGKVYVSVDETLLFQSGKTDVNPNGKKALLKLCETLKNNTDFDVMIEGHTDDLPIKTARFDDNWDLSVLRATSITRIMVTDGGINPIKIIPSGRGEYFPVDPAKTKEARAKNRRIEIILTPSLKEIMNILNK
jgi:chemotaxis protein MotB